MLDLRGGKAYVAMLGYLRCESLAEPLELVLLFAPFLVTTGDEYCTFVGPVGLEKSLGVGEVVPGRLGRGFLLMRLGLTRNGELKLSLLALDIGVEELKLSRPIWVQQIKAYRIWLVP
jgi:hypothetical protein